MLTIYQKTQSLKEKVFEIRSQKTKIQPWQAIRL